jgi:hypothetical protein
MATPLVYELYRVQREERTVKVEVAYMDSTVDTQERIREQELEKVCGTYNQGDIQVEFKVDGATLPPLPEAELLCEYELPDAPVKVSVWKFV